MAGRLLGILSRMPSVSALVVGGGQAGLATSFYLRRAGVEHVVLDDQERPGGAWRHTWPSLRLFSPAAYSSLPGWQMPSSGSQNPSAQHVIDYLTHYEERYDLPIRRNARVTSVHAQGGRHEVRTPDGAWTAEAVFSATGTWSRPFVPTVPGASRFLGRQLHSAHYDGPQAFADQQVLVVGGGNSGAQIAADLIDHAEVTWCTHGPPRFLPEDVDGRELFRVATRSIRTGTAGVSSLGDIVVVPSVRAARDSGQLRAEPTFTRLTAHGAQWADGTHRQADAVIWCTGFRPALGHLAPLALPRDDGRLRTDGPTSSDRPTLQLIGYGDWSGAASSTLIGVGQWARLAVDRMVQGEGRTANDFAG